MGDPEPERPSISGRKLTIWGFLILVAVYLVIIQGGGLLIGHGISEDDTFATVGNVVRKMAIPIAASALFAIALATWLSWWPGIIHEKLRVRRWIWFIPVTFVLASLIVVNWPRLVDQEAGLVLVLLALTALVGFTEELMFRGIGVLTLRNGGLSEFRVALFSSLIFGAVHLTNAIGAGAKSLMQAAVVAVSGYFLYLMRRVSGVIWVPMAVHGLWDFALLSSQLGVGGATYIPSVIAIPVQVVIVIVLLVRRKKIELDQLPA